MWLYIYICMIVFIKKTRPTTPTCQLHNKNNTHINEKGKKSTSTLVQSKSMNISLFKTSVSQLKCQSANPYHRHNTPSTHSSCTCKCTHDLSVSIWKMHTEDYDQRNKNTGTWPQYKTSTPLGWTFKRCYKKLQSLIQNHTREAR